MSNEEKSWLFMDDSDDLIIVGNRQGFEALRDQIESILSHQPTDLGLGIEDSNISRIALQNKKDFLEAPGTRKKLFRERIIGTFVVFWFMVMPFIALALIIYLVPFGNSKSSKPITLIPTCAKNIIFEKPL